MTGYLFHTPEDRREMLAAIGAASIGEILDAQIPADVRFQRQLDLPKGLDEIGLERLMRDLAAENVSAASHLCFLGGGAYDHFIPAVVDEIASRGEYYTSYTPYQAEASQGNLQVMFEYETLITQLTGLGVSNASLYDGGSAMVEAVLMALAADSSRRRVVTTRTVHPHYRQTLDTYLCNLDAEAIVVEPAADGSAGPIIDQIDSQTACVVIQHPNFFGRLEDVRAICDAAHRVGALAIQVFDPISLGLLKRPGDLGADIAIAEGQCLGSPLQMGGPYLGILACREELVRRLPGRLAGQTTDRRGNRCWVLTLQTREQHIRRAKATSNICSNQSLLALRATIYLSLLGPQGLRETAEHCVRKTRYLRDRIDQHDRLSCVHAGPVFKEFVVRDSRGDVEGLLGQALGQGVLAGVPLAPWYPEMEDCFLVAVTEKRSREDIDRWLESVGGDAADAAPTQGRSVAAV
ncbi:MAG: aminomethyl-transferring glycine dehydrogenase subunit GcvPA [Planctomycetaceae bacterium]|nr:MAG: aminomethyl-transferring glycine dehydrogenase subunit GcvPA [Planctomycetaceae bacterium]